MKYIKPFNENKKEKEELFNNIKHMMLSISDDLKTDVYVHTHELRISISGTKKHKKNIFKVFSIDDYIDELERVIDYLKDYNYSLDTYTIYEIKNDSKEIDNRWSGSKGEVAPYYYQTIAVDTSRQSEKMSEIYGKKCIAFTLFFRNI